MEPRRPDGRRRDRRRSNPGGSPSLLALLQHYRENPAPFARPAPPPSEPLPLKFTCRGCGARVRPDASSCPECGDRFYWRH